MIKYSWAFILVVFLLSLDAEKACARHFSTQLKGDISSVTSIRADELQLAQAPESGNSQTSLRSFASDFDSRFAKNQYEFGFTLGYGFSINLPPVTGVSGQRTEIRAIHFFPNFKYNITGLMGESVYRGALYWVIEAGGVFSTVDPQRNGQIVDQSPTFMIGMVPAQLEYKFLSPKRKWAPFIFAGVGGAWGDFFQGAEEISTAFEFILQTGGGIEYFFDNGTAISFNYRFWHLSNSNIKSPNVGLNAHVFSLGLSF